MESYVYDGPPPPLMYDLMADGITGGHDSDDVLSDLTKKANKQLSRNAARMESIPTNDRKADQQMNNRNNVITGYVEMK